MQEYNRFFFYISLFTLSCTLIFGADPNHYLEHKVPPIVTTPLKNGIFFPERFWTFTHNAAELPLISGPACPCIIVFAAKPGCPAIFGTHLYHLNSIKSLVDSINSFYKLPSQGEKSKLSFSLFTRTYDTVDTDYTFKEGTHLNRFQALIAAFDSVYSIIHCSYYFDNSQSVKTLEDRWIACTGVDSDNKLQMHRFHPTESGTFKSTAHTDNYTFLQYQTTFGLHQMMNILPGNMWRTFDQDLIKMEPKDNIATINNLEVSTENSVHELLTYRRQAQEDVLYGRDTTARRMAEQKLINVDY